MFERFTDRARMVMAVANQEVQRRDQKYIGTEHILLGLIKEGGGVGTIVLKNLDVDIEKMRIEVERLIDSGAESAATVERPSPTPRAKKVIEYAIEECRALNHNYVGTEHILLGLIRADDGIAATVLMHFGVTVEDVRREVGR